MSGGWQTSFKTDNTGTCLADQWLGFCAPTAGGMGSIPGQGTKIPLGIAKKKKKRDRERKTLTILKVVRLGTEGLISDARQQLGGIKGFKTLE